MLTLTLPYPISAPGVYRIVDSKSGRFYIGSSVNVAQRWSQHQGRLRRGTHPNPQLQAIWNKDQARLSITMVRVVDSSDKDALLTAEQQELDAANVGANHDCMNVLTVAGSHLGRVRSAETRARMSAAQRGKKMSQESRERMRAAKLGKPQTETHRRNSAAARRGIKIARRRDIVRQLTLRALTVEQVVDLRAKRAAGMSWRLLGLHFGISQSVAKRIAIGETYREVAL